MPSGEASQTTEYVYGVSTGPDGNGSAIDDNDLLYQVQYPDPATGATSGSSGTVETYTYDALGDTLTYTDRNGTTHAYSYDALDRLTADTITHFGPGVDQTVAKIGFSYNDAGDLQDATSYDGSGNVLNQVQESYDGEGNIVGDAQSHSGAVGSSTPSVNYSYNQSTGELESMEYPNGRTLDYGYTSVGQVSSISDGSGTLASYGYLGLDTPLSTLFGNGVTETTTLDTFGRIAEQKYVNSSGTDLDDISYGYDNDGNVLYEQNNVLSGQSELFTYDGLNRLTNAETGTLNSSHTGMTSTSNSESWSLDALGNWKSSTTNGTTTSRTNNAQNEATTIGSATLGYDANGNTLTDQSGQQYVYDAWNRLTQVKNPQGQTIASYGYDALGRRITQTENGTTTDLYYSSNWQVVEERQGSTTTAQYVWSPFYVDQLIERDDQPNGSGQLTRRLYAQQDADYNVTSLTDNSGNVVERYSYDPYGNVTVENPDGTTKGDGTAASSGYGWAVLHQGLMLDATTGTYDDRNRQYDSATGRFLQQDSAGYIDGLNRLQAELGNPISYVDPSGHDADDEDDTDANDEFMKQFEELKRKEQQEQLDRQLNGGWPDVQISAVEPANGEVGPNGGEMMEQPIPGMGLGNQQPSGPEAQPKCPFGTGPAPNGGFGPQHGGEAHNDDLDDLINELRQNPDARNIRKNQAQVDINGSKVGSNRPDVQWDESGLHNNYEADNDPARSSNHARQIQQNDPNSSVTQKVLGK